MISNYGMSFVQGTVQARIYPYSQLFQRKNGKLGLISKSQKIDTVINFFMNYWEGFECTTQLYPEFRGNMDIQVAFF